MKDPFGDSRSVVVLPGSDKADEINRAISNMNSLGGGRVILSGGVHVIDTTITILNNVTLQGFGPNTILRSTVTGSSDEPTNALVSAVGSISTPTLNTTLTSAVSEGGTTLPVASIGTIAAGNYVLVSGTVGATSVTLYEVCRVASAAGSTITLSHPLLQAHESGKAVQCVSPVESACVRDLKIEVQSGTLAVGILGRHCLDFRVEGVIAGDVSRSIVNLDRGTRTFWVDRVHNLGGSNGIVFVDSSHCGIVQNVTCDHRGGRLHASGIQRGLIHLRNQPTKVQVLNSQLERSGVGLNIWGGRHVTVDDVLINDMDSSGVGGAWDRMLNASPAEGTGVGGGTGVNILCTTAALTEHTYDISLRRVSVKDIQTNTNGYWTYIADAHDIAIEDLTHHNDSAITPNSYASLALADVFGGSIKNYKCRGMNRAILTLNQGFLGGTIDGVRYDPVSGGGQSYGIAVEFQHTSTSSKLRIKDIRSGNLTAGDELRVRYPSPFAGDDSIVFEDCEWEPGWVGSAIICRNNSASNFFIPGEVVEITYDGTGARLFQPVSSALVQKGCVVQGGTNTNGINNKNGNAQTQGYCLVVPTGMFRRLEKVNVPNGIGIGRGTPLSWTSGREITSDGSSSDPRALFGRADQYKVISDGTIQIAVLGL